MGILNVTPDSFSDGGAYASVDDAVRRGIAMMEEGADIIDLGGESTRPGAQRLSPAEEQRRILPVLAGLKKAGAFVSVDTRNADTMRAALGYGADMLNDISALTHDPAMMDVAAGFGGPVCLMHMQGTPETMQAGPAYDDVVDEIFSWLRARIDACVLAGIAKDRLMADPGFGFGKTYEHNMALVDGFARFRALGVTLLAGVSRKSFVGTYMGGVPAAGRLQGSLAIAGRLAAAGAGVIRVHDVAETRRFLFS